jgi:hypothetical protein
MATVNDAAVLLAHQSVYYLAAPGKSQQASLGQAM